MKTDYIDLFQAHSPDPETPIDETLSALDDLVTAGKVRYLGNSNYTGWQIADADWIARESHKNRFVSAQNNYSLLERRVEHEVTPASICARSGGAEIEASPVTEMAAGKSESAQAGAAASGIAARTATQTKAERRAIALISAVHRR